MKIFYNKQNLKEFMTTNSALKKELKRILHTKEENATLKMQERKI
jgi:hypothetical protein